ncbi:MAG: endonuclease III [Calditrichota bacterium]
MRKKPDRTTEPNPSSETETAASIIRTIDILSARFGTPQWKRKDPLDELMVTLLSQNTNDRNRDRAYEQLRARFASWEEVLAADVTDIEQTIRSAGLSGQKSARMKEILGWIKDYFGGLNLDRLNNLDNDEAIKLLTSRKGIGVKTAAVVLAFAFNRDLCPVDTHVHRIARRLGWIPEGTSADSAFGFLNPLIPSGRAAAFHLNLLKFGRSICLARKPGCASCPLRDECRWVGKDNCKS